MTVTYDALTHTYYKDKVKVPSVTQILSEAGLIDTRWFNDEARDRGTAVAAFTSLDDEGDLDEENELVEPYWGYIVAWRNFRKDISDRMAIIENEKPYYHTSYRYAGTLDRVVVFDGKISVLDIKTGGIYPSYGPQTAGYAEFIRAGETPGRMCVILQKDARYKMKIHEDWNDWNIFASALALWHFKNERNLIHAN